MQRALASFVLLFALAGCAKYEFDLTNPPALATHVGRKAFAEVKVEPLDYRLKAVENRLVMEIYNPTQDMIELVGPKCAVVDPQGQSHPLRSQSIAPGSFIKLIFPPMRPRVYDPYYYGPAWNVGLGVGYQVDSRTRYKTSPSPAPSPQYFTYYDDGDSYFWDWKGAGDCRIQLAFRQGDKEFRQEFSFTRKKM